MDDNQCWGQLVSLTEFISEPFLLKNDTIVLGRAKGIYILVDIV